MYINPQLNPLFYVILIHIPIYNVLPHEIRNYTNYNIFKLDLTTWLPQQVADNSHIL